MNILNKLILIYISMIPMNLLGQTSEISDSIYWNIDRKLIWEDFQGCPDMSSNWGAVTAAELNIIGHLSNVLPIYEVRNVFFKKKSWTKDTTSEFTLQHEQIHFDITELYARKIRQAIDSLWDIDEAEQEVYNRLIQKLINGCDLVNDEFDKETNYGNYGKNQLLWKKKISNAIKDLDEFTYDYDYWINER